MRSKGDNLLEVFFEQPAKYWHFRQLEKETKLAQSKLAGWLKRFQQEKLILKVKKRGKMPYYLANHQHPNYCNRKKLFALNKFYEIGLLNYLSSLKAESIILFGSFSRSDWHKESDIDLFIYGDTDSLNLGEYQSKLHHEIQLFLSKNKNELKRFGPGLLRNIIKGVSIKGTIPAEVIQNAAIQE